MFSGEIGQVGSQFDGLGHIGNKVGNVRFATTTASPRSRWAAPTACRSSGSTTSGPFFTRGILLDVPPQGGDRLPINYVITVDDMLATLPRQGTREPGEGDVVLFHTGHSKLWKKYNEEYNKGCPGPGKTVANWLADKKVMVVGADTWPVEAVPGEDPNRPVRVSLHLAHHERHLHQREPEPRRGSRRIGSTSSPGRSIRCALKGATGSPGNSVALA